MIGKSFSRVMAALAFILAVQTWAFPCALAQESGKVTVTLFWGEGCPYCEKEREFLGTMTKKYPELELREYEVWKNERNAALFRQITQGVGLRAASVPVTFIGGEVFAGFSEEHARRMEEAIRRRLASPANGAEEKAEGDAITLPVLGKFDRSKYSLPVLTIILGGLDSFNPCALYVLMFLMSLIIHARSRRRMLLVGGTFVFFSGFVYFLFMSAWLNVFFVAGRMTLMTTAAGAVALLVGGLNVKDFFAFKKGPSLAMPEGAKPRLHERMRGLLRSTSLSSLLAGTVVLAVAANAYELICTAGFPMVYTRILTLEDLPTVQYYLYLMLYNVVYVIPLGAVVAVFTVTLGSRKLSEREGRRLKLLSGLMMLYLGMALVIDPELLHSVVAAGGLLLAALMSTALVVLAARKLRPGF